MDICIPLPEKSNGKTINVAVEVGCEELKLQFRIESFPWCVEKKEYKISETEMIERFKKRLQEYAPDWDLIQIYSPAPDDDYIQVLYRRKMI